MQPCMDVNLMLSDAIFNVPCNHMDHCVVCDDII